MMIREHIRFYIIFDVHFKYLQDCFGPVNIGAAGGLKPRYISVDVPKNGYIYRGVIDETLKIVSHSLGGAFAKGYVRAIIKYAREHPELSNGLKISEFDFDPYDGEALTTEAKVHTQ